MDLPASLSPTEADRALFNAVRKSDRVCASCLKPVLGEFKEPSDWYLEHRKDGTLWVERKKDDLTPEEYNDQKKKKTVIDLNPLPGEPRSYPRFAESNKAIIGTHPPDPQRTVTGEDGTWQCATEWCRATDTDTPLPAGFTPTPEQAIGVLWDFLGSLYALDRDPYYDGPEMPFRLDLLKMHLWCLTVLGEDDYQGVPINELVPGMLRVGRESAEDFLDDDVEYEPGADTDLSYWDLVDSQEEVDDIVRDVRDRTKKHLPGYRGAWYDH